MSQRRLTHWENALHDLYPLRILVSHEVRSRKNSSSTRRTGRSQNTFAIITKPASLKYRHSFPAGADANTQTLHAHGDCLRFQSDGFLELLVLAMCTPQMPPEIVLTSCTLLPSPRERARGTIVKRAEPPHLLLTSRMFILVMPGSVLLVLEGLSASLLSASVWIIVLPLVMAVSGQQGISTCVLWEELTSAHVYARRWPSTADIYGL
jgi:hypothetical protein